VSVEPRHDATSFLLRGARVLDQAGGFTEPLDVDVQQGRIVAVGARLTGRADAREVDASGLWLLPGLFDCHVHVAMPTFDVDELAAMPADARADETAESLRRTLLAGVTSLRDAGGATTSLKGALAPDRRVAPRLQLCVEPLRTPSDARRAVGELVAGGADWIKLMATPGALSGADPCSPLFSDAEVTAVIDEATRLGKPVMVHAHGGPVLRAAVLAGARSVEHALFLTEDDAELMAAHDCTLVPTLAIYYDLAASPAVSRLGAPAELAADLVPRLGRSVRLARRAGVRIATGSDFAHRDQHGHNVAELAHLRRAGLSPEEALLAGTVNGAALCGVGDRLGAIAPGYVFDAVLLDADPGDLSCFDRPGAVTGVFLGGFPVLPHPRLAEGL
jgi:imidazolonepropionase-like amidohydrolase